MIHTKSKPMGPQLSVLLPNHRTAHNNQALKICLETLVDNTSVDFELILDSVEALRDFYTIMNQLAARATTDWIVFHNSDVFMAPGWAEAFLEARDPDTIVTGVLVECGAIPVAKENVEMNFGMTPQTFRRREFEEWVACEQPFPPGRGWYAPSFHHRQTFLGRQWDTSRGKFPDVWIDKFYFDDWEADGGQIRRVHSYAYHLQNYYNVERTREIRARGKR